MRLFRISTGQSGGYCPICQWKVTEKGFTHMNMKQGGHIKYNRAKCESCEVELIQVDGKWKTTWLEWTDIKKLLDRESAKQLFEIHELDRTKVAHEYDMNKVEYNEFMRREWKEYIALMRSNDQIWLWKRNVDLGLAISRNGNILHVLKFESI